jgi:DNA-directed RNA polymerase subunit beta
MTDRTFIINGTSASSSRGREVARRLLRRQRRQDLAEKEIVDAKMIPSRGAWLEFEIDKRTSSTSASIASASSRSPSCSALAGESDDELLNLIVDDQGRPYESMRNTLDRTTPASTARSSTSTASCTRASRPPDSARCSSPLQPQRYDLAKVDARSRRSHRRSLHLAWHASTCRSPGERRRRPRRRRLHADTRRHPRPSATW